MNKQIVSVIVIVATLGIGGFFYYNNSSTSSALMAENKLVESCNLMENVTNRSECYVEAIDEIRNVSTCDKIPGDSGGYKEMCYTRVAPIKKDIAICDKIEIKAGEWYEHNDQKRDDCYDGVARAVKNSSICDKIVERNNRLNCYENVGPSESYLAICHKKLTDQGITRDFIIGKKYVWIGGIETNGTFNSDGTLTMISSGGGSPNPGPVSTTSKWSIENGNLIIDGESTTSFKDFNGETFIREPRFFEFNGDVFLKLYHGIVVGPSIKKNYDFMYAEDAGQLNLCF